MKMDFYQSNNDWTAWQPQEKFKCLGATRKQKMPSNWQMAAQKVAGNPVPRIKLLLKYAVWIQVRS